MSDPIITQAELDRIVDDLLETVDCDESRLEGAYRAGYHAGVTDLHCRIEDRL